MGFFSDMLRTAASEVVNAVIDGINENTIAQEERERELAQFRETYAGVSYSALVSQLEYTGYSADETAIINTLIQEREQLAKSICTSPEEAFQAFDDEDLVKFYDRLLETKGSFFPDEYIKKVVKLFQDEVMSRPVAKRIYVQDKGDYFESTNYDDLETIIEGNNVFYDEILKREAMNELEHRNSIIEALEADSIDELDNEDFMQMYALVRADKAQTSYVFDGTRNTISGTYNAYFGEYRDAILENCENELLTNRRYLINKFISKYCEDEVEQYANYSNKKLSSIISLFESETSENEYGYDLCDKIIAQTLLSERGCE